MERAMLWFKCAAMHDPVRPVIRKPSVIGWEAKERRVDLVLERSFTGDELLRRMNGWFTVDVFQAIDIIQQHGQLKILDGNHLVVETGNLADMERISGQLAKAFQDEAWLEIVEKNRLA
ncbi:MAG: hypothetical protein Q8P24_19600 [Desulfobacterales bacterium]|nr:hypothetical protein [Desulfobacterales bacterium]